MVNGAILKPVRTDDIPMTEGEGVLNGIDVAETRAYIGECEKDPTKAERTPAIVAKWVGGTRAQVDFGKSVVHMGGDDDPSAMKMFLACLAACDVEVVATRASLLGMKLDWLEIEANGHFNIRRLLGLQGDGPGYDRVGYTVRVRAPGASEEQIARLREACEHGSPVGDSFARATPPTLKIEVIP